MVVLINTSLVCVWSCEGQTKIQIKADHLELLGLHEMKADCCEELSTIKSDLQHVTYHGPRLLA